MKPFTLSVADGIRQVPTHTVYSKQVQVTDTATLQEAVQFDHVAGLFKNNHRSNKDFIEADCVIMDIDNKQSNNPDEWITPEILHEQLDDVLFLTVYSRNHMKDKTERDKNGQEVIITKRPRFHVYLPLSVTFTKADDIRELKEKLLVLIPDTDANAKDAPRFIYGVEQPQACLFEGNTFIDEYVIIQGIETVSEADAGTTDTPAAQEQYHVGERNNSLFTSAMDALIKCTRIQDAKNLFDKACLKCNPPLSHREVMSIWQSALKRHKAFEEKFTQPKKTLTIQALEKTLQEFSISARLNVITNDIEVSDLPVDSPYVMEKYSTANPAQKKEFNKSLLPLLLTSHLKEKGFSFNRADLDEALQTLAMSYSFNPFLDMINRTVWDGQNRLQELYRVLGIQGNVYHCLFLSKWLHQVITLAGNDDSSLSLAFVLVLQGPQGCGKTSFFRKLAIYPEWFNEGVSIDMRNKDSYIQATTGGIIGELGELDSTLKRDQSALKAFLTACFDLYRLPYGRRAMKIPRRVSFCGTVNTEQVHRDETGSRRFVYIHVDDIDNDFIQNSMTPEWAMQLWRQVYDTIYLPKGRKGYYLTAQEQKIAEAGNEEFRVYVKAEQELRDILDWENEDAIWTRHTATEILQQNADVLRGYTAQDIGVALSSISKQYPRVKLKKSHGLSRYLIPQKRYN